VDPKPKATFSGKSVFIGKQLLIKKTAFGKNIHEFGDFVFELFHDKEQGKGRLWTE
jgi:hypothetical protein